MFRVIIVHSIDKQQRDNDMEVSDCTRKIHDSDVRELVSFLAFIEKVQEILSIFLFHFCFSLLLSLSRHRQCNGCIVWSNYNFNWVPELEMERNCSRTSWGVRAVAIRQKWNQKYGKHCRHEISYQKVKIHFVYIFCWAKLRWKSDVWCVTLGARWWKPKNNIFIRKFHFDFKTCRVPASFLLRFSFSDFRWIWKLCQDHWHDLEREWGWPVVKNV